MAMVKYINVRNRYTKKELLFESLIRVTPMLINLWLQPVFHRRLGSSQGSLPLLRTCWTVFLTRVCNLPCIMKIECGGLHGNQSSLYICKVNSLSTLSRVLINSIHWRPNSVLEESRFPIFPNRVCQISCRILRLWCLWSAH